METALSSVSVDAVRWWLIDATGALCLMLAGAYSLRVRTVDGSPFWRLAGMGLIWLGLDELLGIHEAAGIVMEAIRIPEAPVIDDHNDLVLFAYAAAGGVITLLYLGALVDRPVVGVIFMFAGLLTGLGLVADGHFIFSGGASRIIEESFELAASVAFFAAFHLRYMYVVAATESKPVLARKPTAALPHNHGLF